MRIKMVEQQSIPEPQLYTPESIIDKVIFYRGVHKMMIQEGDFRTRIMERAIHAVDNLRNNLLSQEETDHLGALLDNLSEGYNGSAPDLSGIEQHRLSMLLGYSLWLSQCGIDVNSYPNKNYYDDDTDFD